MRSSLPIDPASIGSNDIGEKRLTLNMDHSAAIERVRNAFETVGFGVPVEFSPSDLLNEKIDAGQDPYYVLGACHPRMADRALDVTADIGGLFPCNVIIREVAPGVQEVYHISIMRIAHLVGIAPDTPTWTAIVEETGSMVDEAYESLASH